MADKSANPTIKTQVEAQLAHLKADLTGLKNRVSRVKQLATGYVHDAEADATEAKSAISAAELHIQATEEKVEEFLKKII